MATLKWGSVTLEVPRMVAVGKSGRVMKRLPVTKSGRVAKVNGQPAINIEAGDTLRIVGEGSHVQKEEVTNLKKQYRHRKKQDEAVDFLKQKANQAKKAEAFEYLKKRAEQAKIIPEPEPPKLRRSSRERQPVERYEAEKSGHSARVAWCMKCKKNTKILNGKKEKSGRTSFMKGECSVCHGNVSRIISRNLSI